MKKDTRTVFFRDMPAGQNFDDVKKMVPPPPPSGVVRQVFFSTPPAELIFFKGDPVYSRIRGTYYYWGPGMVYPYYCPWPATYGAGYVYNPSTGGFAGGRAVYGPYGAVGPYGGRTVASPYNLWTDGYGATSQGHDAYGQWGHSVAAPGDQWVQTGHVTTARGTAIGYQGSSGQGAGLHGANGTVARTNDYNTYAGNDGKVYRKDSSGNWSKCSNGNWNSVDTSAAKQQRFQTAKQNRPGRESIQPARGKGSAIRILRVSADNFRPSSFRTSDNPDGAGFAGEHS